jgi:ribosome maturation factor RimP
MQERIEQIATQVCSEFGVALYDFEVKTATKGIIYAVYLTKAGGITVGECQKVSKRINFILEEEDLIESRYFLEVSSPGLERELKMKKHFVSAIGEKLKVTYSKETKTTTLIGTLTEVLPDDIIVETLTDEMKIKMTDIKKAKTYFEYKGKTMRSEDER